MEFIVRPKVRLRNAYLVVSCLLGAASGLVVDMIFDDPPFFIIFGTIIALLTGLILYDKDMQSSHNKRMQPDAATPSR
jgi:F0F1-type ATP synthase assembly protein I